MQLIQISAWNDSGGGFTHRLFDGHPQLRVWPFELLLGRDNLSVDGFGEHWFRGRFRWPRLSQELLQGDGGALFDAIDDTELKGVLRSAQTTKHVDFPLVVSLAAWREAVAARWVESVERSQAAFLTHYIKAFFEILSGYPDDQRSVLGHCPVGILDAPEIWEDFPKAQIVHVVRNPHDGFADMRRRHLDLDPIVYGRKWTLINGAAAMWAGKRPDQVTLVALPQLVGHRETTMRFLAGRLGLDFDERLLAPSWRGRSLDEADMGPFGGVSDVTLAPKARGLGLSGHEQAAIRDATRGVVQLLESINPAFRIEEDGR